MTITRRNTSHIRIFERPGPEAVTYDLSRSDCVTITLPPSSTWTSGPHWHETHTEYLQILQGRASVRLGDRIREYEPKDGVIEVSKYTVHEWQRVAGEEQQDDLVVREWTVPEDGQKAVFFRMLNSFLTEDHPESLYEGPTLAPKRLREWIEGWTIMLQLFCIFRSWDNWPMFVGNEGGLFSWMVTHIVLEFGSLVGVILGLQGLYSEYVGEELRSRAGKPSDQMKKVR